MFQKKRGKGFEYLSDSLWADGFRGKWEVEVGLGREVFKFWKHSALKTLLENVLTHVLSTGTHLKRGLFQLVVADDTAFVRFFYVSRDPKHHFNKRVAEIFEEDCLNITDFASEFFLVNEVKCFIKLIIASLQCFLAHFDIISQLN